jgi:hypothetical protein
MFEGWSPGMQLPHLGECYEGDFQHFMFEGEGLIGRKHLEDHYYNGDGASLGQKELKMLIDMMRMFWV